MFSLSVLASVSLDLSLSLSLSASRRTKCNATCRCALGLEKKGGEKHTERWAHFFVLLFLLWKSEIEITQKTFLSFVSAFSRRGAS